jgi:hypothetical protein
MIFQLPAELESVFGRYKIDNDEVRQLSRAALENRIGAGHNRRKVPFARQDPPEKTRAGLIVCGDEDAGGHHNRSVVQD